jgi:hypothetical protein
MKRLEFREDFAEEQGVLDVRAEVGAVTVTAHDSPWVTVTAWVENVDVRVWRQEETVYVRAEVRREGHSLAHRTRAKLSVAVPAACNVWARAVTGSLAVEGVAGSVVTQVDTGETRLANLGSSVHAATTTGTIFYSGSLAATGHSFRAATGELLFELDPQADVRVAARTTTGRILTSMPLHDLVEARSLVGGRLSGMLGAGTAALSARVVTGSVRLDMQRVLQEGV